MVSAMAQEGGLHAAGGGRHGDDPHGVRGRVWYSRVRGGLAEAGPADDEAEAAAQLDVGGDRARWCGSCGSRRRRGVR